jgi:hypothetical protein
MSEFVRYQLAPGGRRWRILPVVKYDTLPRGVSERIHRLRRLGRFRIRVHPHPAEVTSEARPEEITSSRIERLPR